MGSLQLADAGNSAHLSQPPSHLYIWVPDDDSGETGKYVREDFFDVYSDVQFDAIMDLLAPYQDEGLEDNHLGFRLFGIGKPSARQQDRRDRRNTRKDQKIQMKDARIQKKLAVGRGEIPGGLESITGAISGIFGGGAQPDMEPLPGGAMPRLGRGVSVDIGSGVGSTPNWVKPVAIVGGLLIIGGVIYMATKKKKR